MKLYLYFARRFATTLFILIAIFLALTVLLETVEVLRRFGDRELGLFEVLQISFLRLPRTVYEILPLIVVIATLFLFLGLAKSSELVVARAAGRSALRSLLAPLAVTFVIGAAAVAVVNPIVASTSKQYQIVASKHSKTPQSVLSLGPDGLWLRQGSDQGQTVIHARHANLDGTVLSAVTFLGFDSNSKSSFRVSAEQARLEDGFWALKNAKEWRFDGNEIAEVAATRADDKQIPTDLTLTQIRDGFGAPYTVPIWELPAFIKRLDTAGFATRRHNLRLHTELALPFLLVTMVMIGAGFTMRHTRFGNTGIMVLLALGMAFGLFFIQKFAGILGENGQIPILLAAWAPPAAGIMLALGLLLHLEDG